MPAQIPFEHSAFADNPEPRAPCVLLLDTSRSMEGERIAQLNAGLLAFKENLEADDLARKRVELAVVTFGGEVQTLCDFMPIDQFHALTFGSGGKTPMGAAIRRAIELLQRRKATYNEHGILTFRPWMFLITDGAPTDEWQSAAEAIKQAEARKAFCFFAIGVEGANFDTLRQISVRTPLRLKGLRFRDLFLWLSASLCRVSHSNPGEPVSLPNPAAPDGWASV